MPEVPIHTTTVEETDNVRPITLGERLRRPPSAYVPPGSEEDPQATQQEEGTNSQPSTEEEEEWKKIFYVELLHFSNPIFFAIKISVIYIYI